MLKKLKKMLLIITIFILMFSITANAHSGNITGWKNKDSEKITEYNGKYYGYHNQAGIRHYHQVEWDGENQKWKIINPAVYYDEKFNIIDNFSEVETEKIEVKYHKSVDGDTSKFELNKDIITVRFLGINTPETVDKNRPVEPYGKEASNYTKEKLQNATKIEIEYDSNASKKDKYDRHLAWIWVDGSLLQEQLVSNGLAETYMLQANYRYASNLQLVEQEAKSKKIGIWSGETSINDKSVNPDMQSNVTNDSKIDDTTNNGVNGTIVGFIGIIVAVIGGIVSILMKR